MRLFYFLLLYIGCSVSTAIAEDVSQKNQSDFDPALFKGGRFSESALKKLTTGSTQIEGIYKVDVYVNGNYITESTVEFKERNGRVEPCISSQLADKIELMTKTKGIVGCFFISDEIKNSSANFDMLNLRLDLVVPNTSLRKKPRGYVNQDDLMTGSSILFMNYIANYYHVDYSGSNSRNLDSAWLSLNGGINVGDWQYRQLSTLNWNPDTYCWNRIRSYVQRPIPALVAS